MKKSIKRKLLPISFFLTKVYYAIYFHLREINSRAPIVVCQMGKVGSMSIATSLKAMIVDRPIYHVHRLSEEGREFVKHINLNQRRVLPGRHYWESLYLYQQLTGNDNDQNWDFITLVRDPVARNISAFFQTMEIYYPELSYYHYKKEAEHFSKLTQVFIDRFPHDIPLVWFDNEMKAVVGIDVFSTDFPKEQGFNTYQIGSKRLLLIRLEDLRSCYREALSSYLSIKREKVFLLEANLSSQKVYGDSYREFVKCCILPEDYLDDMYNSRFARHFYSQIEIDAFKSRWLKK